LGYLLLKGGAKNPGKLLKVILPGVYQFIIGLGKNDTEINRKGNKKKKHRAYDEPGQIFVLESPDHFFRLFLSIPCGKRKITGINNPPGVHIFAKKQKMPEKQKSELAFPDKPGKNSPMKAGQLKRQIWRYRPYYLFLLPALIYVALFNYGPMYGLQIAFKSYKGALGIAGSPWVGFQHFIDFFKGYYFWRLIRNTLAVSVYSLVVGFPIPIILALMLNEVRGNLKKVLQTIFYAPHFISMVVMVGIIHTMFSPSIGVINSILEAMGFRRVYFLSLPQVFRHLYVWSGVWQQMGWSAIIYLAALAGVDPELHEAARIDGASLFQRIRYINLPTIQPTIIILFIMAMGGVASVGYEKVYLLQNDLNIDVSEVISTYVYKRGILSTNYSFSTAVGLFNNVINLFLLLTANGISRKVNETSLF
jgi:putative aldouronate transport system permease protein